MNILPDPYGLGAVKPFVRDVANLVGPAFDITTIYGWRAQAADMAGHPSGRGLDFQVGTDLTKGNSLAGYLSSNAGTLLIEYICWQQKMWRPSTLAWNDMGTVQGEYPGYDPNHKHHVHVSFTTAVDDGRRLAGPSGYDSGGAPWWDVIPDTSDWGDALADTYGPVIDGIVNVATAPVRLAQALLTGSTWVRIGQVLGGVGLIIIGVKFLMPSNSAEQGQLNNASTDVDMGQAAAAIAMA